MGERQSKFSIAISYFIQILGLESKDIDIALDDMQGNDFAILINDYLNKEQKEDKKRFGVIKANAEKKKFLEIANVHIEGNIIDLVSLRSVTYFADSDQPLVKIGTPEEDVLRRDLTINSLFYNINEAKVEDFTGKGLSDLKEKILRTPMKPEETLNNNPVVLLRTARFAS